MATEHAQNIARGKTKYEVETPGVQNAGKQSGKKKVAQEIGFKRNPLKYPLRHRLRHRHLFYFFRECCSPALRNLRG